MPQATNLVIKNNANVDKTFTLIAPAAGDGGVARWALKEGLTSLAFPNLSLSSRPTASGSARNAMLRFDMPATYVDSTTGLPVRSGLAFAKVEVVMPASFPEASKDDFIAFVTNSVANSVIKACLRDAFPAT